MTLAEWLNLLQMSQGKKLHSEYSLPKKMSYRTCFAIHCMNKIQFIPEITYLN